MKRLFQTFRGNQLTARVLRSTSWVLVGFGGRQVVRLASNLILTRILFPEAFGLMTLVTMVTVGLLMFSDVGIGPSISRSPRGDDPDYLDTAWTLQVMRGFALFAATLVLAKPMANFYGEPDLALYLPLSGLALIVNGFIPTKDESAKRHLLFGRVTAIELLSQLIGVGAMVVAALVTRSVAALVFGSVFTALAKLVLVHLMLEGQRNRFMLEPAGMREQMKFGKWIFLGTAAAFVSAQGDKAILGKLLSLQVLGIYNIGFFLASFPMSLGLAVTNSVLIPLYRDRPPSASRENHRKLRKMRFLLTGGVFFLLLVMAFFGPALVGLLYDDRYVAAGGMLVIVAVGLLGQALGLPYDRAALAAGDSRGAFAFSAARSAVQLSALFYGLAHFGFVGGLASLGLAMLATHPLLILLMRKHAAWDPLHDAVFLVVGLVFGGAALWLHMDAIQPLFDIALK